MDEKKAVNLVIKEITRYASLKVSFDKEINFEKEKEEKGPNGEKQFKKMTHFFKGKAFIVTKATTRSEIVENYRKTMDTIKSEIEAWDVEGSGWTFDTVELSYVNMACCTPVAGSSFIPLPKELAAKQAIINV